MKTRDEWLAKAITALQSDFAKAGTPLPDVRASIGFPASRARPGHKQSIGECWSGAASDGTPQLWISPVLSDPVSVLAVLVHELVHAAIGCEHGHRGPFRKLALAVGLEGKMTATVAGPDLTERLEKIAGKLGPFPHAAINIDGRKKQKPRNLKVACVNAPECDFKVRMTRLIIDTHGCPCCPSCEEQTIECAA